MPKWEFKRVSRRRTLRKFVNTGEIAPLEWDPDVKWEDILTLGEQGWELISVVPRSDVHLTPGLTTTETFYFKRMKT